MALKRINKVACVWGVASSMLPSASVFPFLCLCVCSLGTCVTEGGEVSCVLFDVTLLLCCPTKKSGLGSWLNVHGRLCSVLGRARTLAWRARFAVSAFSENGAERWECTWQGKGGRAPGGDTVSSRRRARTMVSDFRPSYRLLDVGLREGVSQSSRHTMRKAQLLLLLTSEAPPYQPLRQHSNPRGGQPTQPHLTQSFRTACEH